MISTKKALACTAILLSILTAAAEKGNAAPVETSHWNSNTFGNLNTLADKTTVAFSIGYNETGTIEWYKDGVLADTLSGATSAQFTTSWSTTGMKEVKAKMTNGNGTSEETVWPVEVQDTGTAALEEAIDYPQYRISGYLTINVRNGWANLPSLYLKTKKPDTWIEYVEKGEYIVKANIDVRENGTLKVDESTAGVLKMRALPFKGNQPVTLRAFAGGTITIDTVTISGWDTDLGVEITSNTRSAIISSYDQSTLKMTGCTCRHIEVFFEGDVSPGDVLDHNEFIEANPFPLDLSNSKYQIVTNNIFRYGHNGSVYANVNVYSGTVFMGNKFIGSSTCGDNFMVGKGSKIIGNEFIYAGWNLAEIHVDMFCRDNVLHDNGGHHNGLNGMLKNVYSYNDYCYDFSGYSGFYIQVQDDLKTYPTPRDWYPDHIYIINGRARNVVNGFNFLGGYNCYIYNFTCEQSNGNVQFGAGNIFVRKSRFLSTKRASDFALRVVDSDPSLYGYFHDISVIDSVFSDANPKDIGFSPIGSGTINIINSFREDSTGKMISPTHYFEHGGNANASNNPAVCHYVWLDVLVKDQNGRLIEGANVTVECLTDPAAAALIVTLPPPPPDLWDMPAEPLPQPSLADFTRIKTLSAGKLPGPNYGWSTGAEPCAALLMKKLSIDRSSGSVTVKTTTGYQYKIKATYHGLEASQTVTPDATWYRADPTVPASTIELVLNGDATSGTDITPPVLTITSPENNKPVYGDTLIAATASDNWDIDRLEIFIDNVSRAVISADSCTWTADSYSCSWNWDTAQECDGLHSIKVVAHDISGNTAEKTVTAEVQTQTGSTSSDAIVYPNPYIKGKSRGSSCMFANLAPDATVRIYTISGDPVTTLTAETAGDRASTEWDVSKVGGGIYLYSIHSSKGAQQGKIGIVK